MRFAIGPWCYELVNVGDDRYQPQYAALVEALADDSDDRLAWDKVVVTFDEVAASKGDVCALGDLIACRIEIARMCLVNRLETKTPDP